MSAKLSQRVQPHEATPWVVEAIRSIETSRELLQGEIGRLTRELAEAKARAVARIAELDAQNKLLSDDLDSTESERVRLRAEVEAKDAANATMRADAERYAHLKSIAKAGINKHWEFVITLDLVPCPDHIGMLDLALDADRNNKGTPIE